VTRNGLTIGALSILMISGWHDVLPENIRANFRGL
jgi:hypothetical protein